MDNKRAGQALSELTMALVVFLILITGTVQIARLIFSKLRLVEQTRLEAGSAALTRSTAGWVESTVLPESRQNRYHQLNAYTQLASYQPTLTSHLAMSNYTLQARDVANGDLGLETTTKVSTYALDSLFQSLIYRQPTIRFHSSLTFPATQLE